MSYSQIKDFTMKKGNEEYPNGYIHISSAESNVSPKTFYSSEIGPDKDESMYNFLRNFFLNALLTNECQFLAGSHNIGNIAYCMAMLVGMEAQEKNNALVPTAYETLFSDENEKILASATSMEDFLEKANLYDFTKNDIKRIFNDDLELVKLNLEIQETMASFFATICTEFTLRSFSKQKFGEFLIQHNGNPVKFKSLSRDQYSLVGGEEYFHLGIALRKIYYAREVVRRSNSGNKNCFTINFVGNMEYPVCDVMEYFKVFFDKNKVLTKI